MDPIRHVEREESQDVHARGEELRNEIRGSLVAEGDGLVLARAIRVGPQGLSVVGDDGPTAIKRRIADFMTRLRDMNESIGLILADERLGAIARSVDGVGPRIDAAKRFGDSVDRVLEALSFLEETPAVEVDFPRLHGALRDLAADAAAPLAPPVGVVHVTEAEFRL